MGSGFDKIIANWKAVLLSFTGATTFWFFNALNKDYSATINYPIKFDFAQDSVVIIEPLPEKIRIDVSSGGWNLFRSTLLFSVTPIPIELDNPTDVKFLTRSSLLPLVRDHLDNLTVNYLLSDTLFINVENNIDRKVKINVDSVNISLQENFQIVSPITITPDSVTISGAESIVSTLSTQYYVMIPDRRINENLASEIEIPLPFPDLMNSDPKKVKISFEVDEFVRDRIDIKVEKINFPGDQSVILVDSVVSISYTIRNSLKGDVSQSDFSITADFNMIEDDSLLVPILIYYPEFASGVSYSPDTLTVRK